MRAGEGLTPGELERIAWAVRQAQEMSGGYVFVAHLAGADEQGPVPQRAKALHAAQSDPDRTVLVYVDAHERQLQIVTGAGTTRTLTDPECRLASATMVSGFASGDLVGGLVNGIVMLGEASRGLRTDHVAPQINR